MMYISDYKGEVLASSAQPSKLTRAPKEWDFCVTNSRSAPPVDRQREKGLVQQLEARDKQNVNVQAAKDITQQSERLFFNLKFLKSDGVSRSLLSARKRNRVFENRLVSSLIDLDKCLERRVCKLEQERGDFYLNMLEQYPQFEKEFSFLYGKNHHHPKRQMSLKERTTASKYGGPKAKDSVRQKRQVDYRNMKDLDMHVDSKKQVRFSESSYHSYESVPSTRSAQGYSKPADCIGKYVDKYLQLQGTKYLTDGTSNNKKPEPKNGMDIQDSATTKPNGDNAVTTNNEETLPLLNSNGDVTPRGDSRKSPTDGNNQMANSIRVTKFVNTDFGFHGDRISMGMTNQKRITRETELQKDIEATAKKHIYAVQIPSMSYRGSKTTQSVNGLRRTLSLNAHSGRQHNHGDDSATPDGGGSSRKPQSRGKPVNEMKLLSGSISPKKSAPRFGEAVVKPLPPLEQNLMVQVVGSGQSASAKP